MTGTFGINPNRQNLKLFPPFSSSAPQMIMQFYTVPNHLYYYSFPKWSTWLSDWCDNISDHTKQNWNIEMDNRFFPLLWLFQLFPQIAWIWAWAWACLNGCIITLVAFAWLFSTMSPQISCLNGCIITLVAFDWLFTGFTGSLNLYHRMYDIRVCFDSSKTIACLLSSVCCKDLKKLLPSMSMIFNPDVLMLPNWLLR